MFARSARPGRRRRFHEGCAGESVAEKFGILRTGDPVPGINERAIFIVDKKGKIAFAKVYDLGEQPDNEECFEVLKNLK